MDLSKRNKSPSTPTDLKSIKSPGVRRTSSKRKDHLKVGNKVEVEEHPDNDKRNSAKQSIFGGSLYSKALLRGETDRENGSISIGHSTEADVYKPVESLQFLEGTHQLFFRKCKTFPPELRTFNPKNKRGIWNSSGRVVFYTGAKRNFICKRCYYSGFSQEVVDYSGKSVLTANGRQFIFGLNSHVEIFLEDQRLLGTMTQSCFSSTYNIRDSSGRIVYKIQAPCFAPCAPFVFWCCDEHFEICMDDGVSEIGMIRKYWDSNKTISEFQTCAGIEMERVDDVRVKALLLGCFFLIEFQYYKGAGNGPIYFIIMLIIFAAMIILSECAGYCPFWLDKVGYQRVNMV